MTEVTVAAFSCECCGLVVLEKALGDTPEAAPSCAYTSKQKTALNIKLGRHIKNNCTNHGQLLSLAVQWGVAIEIERAIKKNASF